MTVVGFARTASGDGFCWADTEGYACDEPMRESVEKLAISGGLVGVSCGYVVLVEKFRRLVADLGRAPFAIAIARLPIALRKARDEWRAELYEHGIEYKAQTTYALCGYSHIGFQGAVFAEANGFAPVERDAWSSPNVNLAVSSASDVLEFAQKQIRYVQQKSPSATGRELTVARLLGPEMVETVRVPLLLDNERPDSLGDSAAHRAARAAAIERARCFL